ncbi:amidohydrolase [soil metagenome]
MAADVLLKQIASEAEKLHPWICERRRHLHRNPELSFEEFKTSAFVRDEMKSLGYHPADSIPGRYGFHADLISKQNPKEFILLRADMDALPIQEENDVEFKSQHPGVGHLCGHDTHTSMLLGAAALLKDKVDQLPVSVRFIFQHAEEVGPGGAKDFVDAGLTKDVLGCFGLHVSPRVSSGHFGVRSGETMACVGSIDCTIRGRGGHAAAPNETVDPVIATAAAIMNLQQIVSRRIAPVEPAVVSITMIHTGTASNVIPDEVRFQGTFRSFNMESVPIIEKMIEQIVVDTAKTYGCTAKTNVYHSYPPVINDARAVAASAEAIVSMFGDAAPRDIPKSMGAEDFAYFANAKPSSFVFLGCLPEGDTFYPLHHAKFLPDESTLWRGSALLAAMPFVAPKYLK